jgi:TonB-linked SusC/RagA family outer membrane protein
MKQYTIRLLTLSICLFVFGLQAIMAQGQFVVNGTVIDKNTQEPLIGVTIKVKGSSEGTVSDLDGKFQLKTTPNATLVFSYIGYVQEEHKADHKLDIKMSLDTKGLEEVVVVGYGIQKKSDLTGSVSTVKAEDIQNRAISNINEAFAGKASGVQAYSSSGKPGSTPNIQIRGIGSNGSSAPLFVIDGRVSSSAGNLDPNDIESMEILKDGASAAIYGAAAGNGVILITTKKGKGSGKISYDMQIASQSLAKVPHVMNAEQFIKYYDERGIINMESVYQNWDFKTNTDWTDVTFGPSLFMKHNISFQGGNDRGQFYVSGSYMDNNGMIKGKEDTQRVYGGMVNASYKVKPWLEIGTNNSLSYQKTISLADGGTMDNIIASSLITPPLFAATYTLENMPPLMRRELYHDNATLGPLLQDGNGNYYGIAPYISTNASNPLILCHRGHNENRVAGLSGTTFLNFTPIKNLVFTSRLSYSLLHSENYTAQYPYFSIYSSGAYSPAIKVSAASTGTNYWQWENFGSYRFNWGKNNFNVMLGTSYSETRNFGVSGSMEGNGKGDLGFSRNDPNFMYFAYATAGASKTILGGEPTYTRKLAYFGRVNYDYRGTYLLQFSLRADAADSSILPVDNRWGYFPAASVGWVVSNEKFMKDFQSWLDHLKIRVSWGQNGSLASLGNYMYDSTVGKYGAYVFTNDLNYSNAYAPTSLGNYDLKWETSEQFDFGVDMRLLRGRLSIGADYYNKKTKDLIVAGAKMSNVAGFASSPINAGSLTNKGFEFEVGWRDNIRDFSYGVTANLTTLKNKVTKVYDTVDAIDGVAVPSVLTRFEKGQPAWYFYGYKYEGVNPENGQPIYADLSKDGRIGDDDKTYIGKGIPDLTYGITLNAAWRGLYLMVFGSGVAGVDIFNIYDASTSFTNNILTCYTDDRWTPEHRNASMPIASADQRMFLTSSAHVFNGAYFKIKQIQLGYTLPNKLLQKVRISKVRAYCSLENFFTFSDYPGYDPEVVGAGNAAGVDMGLYPNSKKVVLGLNVTF